MSSSNCCFFTYIQISQEAGQVVCILISKNFPQFVVIHTVKGFGVVNKAKVDVFLELSCFFNDPTNVGNLISGSSAFSKSSLNLWKFTGAKNSKPLRCCPLCLHLCLLLFLCWGPSCCSLKLPFSFSLWTVTSLCIFTASDSEIKIELMLWLWNSQICTLKALSWEEKKTILIAKLRMGWEKPQCL